MTSRDEEHEFRASLARRVFMVTRRSPDQLGGVERVVSGLLEGMAQRRPDLSLRSISAFQIDSWIDGLDGFDDLVAAFRLGWRVRRVRNQADVIFVHCPEVAWGIFVLNRRRSRPPVVTVWHGVGPAPYLALRSGGVLRRVLASFRCAGERLARYADAHVVVHSQLADDLERLYGITGATVIENWIDESIADDLRRPRPPRESSGPVFVWVGQADYRKGLDVALSAIRELRITVPDARLLVVGVPPGEAVEGVEWLGPLMPDAVAAVYRRSDVLLFPSRYEAWGLVVSEAMSAGLPVVVSDAIPPGIVADGEVGYVISGHEPADYVRAMRSLCDPELRDAMGARAAIEARRFDSDVAMSRYASLAEAVVRSRRDG